MRPRRILTVIAALAVGGVGLVGPAASSQAASPAAPAAAPAAAAAFTNAEGKFTTKAPTRIMDTRSGLGWNNALGPAGTATLQVTGKSGIPSSGIGAVVFNLTVTGPTSAGFLTVYPSGKSRPTSSSINFRRGWTGANLVTVALGADGKVRIYNSGGHTHVIVDVVGWYADASAGGSGVGVFQETTPTRLLDSRNSGAMNPLDTFILPFTLKQNGVVVNDHVKSVVVTLTAVSPQASGYLTAWSGAGNAPTASVLNHAARTNVSNLAVVPVAPCTDPDCGTSAGLPSIAVKNGSNGSTHLLVDIWGYYDDGDASLDAGYRFKALPSPIRIVDTRSHLGATAPGSATTRNVNAPSTVAGTLTQLLVQNVTSIPTANTFLTFWRGGQPRPAVSNISPRAGVTVAGLAYTGVGPTNNFSFYNATGTNNVLVDVAGSLEREALGKTAGAADRATVSPALAVG